MSIMSYNKNPPKNTLTWTAIHVKTGKDETDIAQQTQNSLIMASESRKYSNIGWFLFKYIPEARKMGQNIEKNTQRTYVGL